MLVPKELVAWWIKHHSLRLHVLFNRKNNNNNNTTTTIAKQIKSDARTNIRFRKISDFLSQFKLDIRYKSKNIYIIPDALSRLSKQRPKKIPKNKTQNIFTFHISLIEKSVETKTRIINEYVKNKN